MSDVTCTDCRQLLDVYEHAVSQYSAAVRQLTGLLGDDYLLALGKLNQLHVACQEKHAALMSHWRIHHQSTAQG